MTALRRVTDHTGKPLGVELLSPGSQVRTILSWPLWFAGPDGAANWTELQRATGLPIQERCLTKRTPWPKHPTLSLYLFPRSASEARARSRFPGTLAGMSSTMLMALGSFFSVVTGLSLADTHPTAGTTATLLGVVGGLLQALPYVLHQLRSRLLLDRLAPGQGTST